MLYRRVSCGSNLFRQFAHSFAEPPVVLIDDTSQGHQMRERELGASSMAGQSEGPSASNFHSSRKAASRSSEDDHDVPSGGSGVSTLGQSRCASFIVIADLAYGGKAHESQILSVLYRLDNSPWPVSKRYRSCVGPHGTVCFRYSLRFSLPSYRLEAFRSSRLRYLVLQWI